VPLSAGRASARLEDGKRQETRTTVLMPVAPSLADAKFRTFTGASKGLSKLSKPPDLKSIAQGRCWRRDFPHMGEFAASSPLVSKTVSGHYGPTRVRIPPPPLPPGRPCKAAPI